MADGVAPAGNANDPMDPESFAMPPMDVTQIPTWATGMAMGRMMGEKFLEQDPKWAAAIEELGWTEEQFGDFWGQTMAGLMTEMSKLNKVFDEKEDEDKCAASAAVSL